MDRVVRAELCSKNDAGRANPPEGALGFCTEAAGGGGSSGLSARKNPSARRS